MNSTDRTDLHDKIMELLRGRIQMGAGKKTVKNTTKKPTKKPTVKRVKRVKRVTKPKRVKRAGIVAGEEDLSELMGLGKKKTVKKTVKRTVKRKSPWITHVKKYAKTHNISYGEALSKARSTYKV